MFEVTVYAPSLHAHGSQVLSGLCELQARGLVQLRLAPRNECVGPAYRIIARVTHPANPSARRLCFDLSDAPELDIDVLDDVDVYFKRTHVDRTLHDLSSERRRKLRPYGLNYACSTPTQIGAVARARRLIERVGAPMHARNGNAPSLVHRLVRPSARWLAEQVLHTGPSSALPFSAFEASADAPASGIVFMTRLWRPMRPNDGRAAINEMRATLVRTLRERFGEFFVGGVERDEYSEAHYPDCVIDSRTEKFEYVELMKSRLIGVATTGLHHSVGWKLAEYVAAARCIVTEPVDCRLPGDFAEGTHYLSFRDPSGCADLCQRILEDPEFAHRMRVSNQLYYRRELAPATMMLKRLRQAMSDACE